MSSEIQETGTPTSLRANVFQAIREGILNGRFAPGEPLKAQALATEFGVSLTVVREALARLSGENLADRVHNRGFAVPIVSIDRWRATLESRLVIEPAILRLAVGRGDFLWESNVMNSLRALEECTIALDGDENGFSATWHELHGKFHRTLLSGCQNDSLMEIADRLWSSSDLFRHWAANLSAASDFSEEHRALAEAAVHRNPDAAGDILGHHIRSTGEIPNRVS